VAGVVGRHALERSAQRVELSIASDHRRVEPTRERLDALDHLHERTGSWLGLPLSSSSSTRLDDHCIADKPNG